MVQCNYSRGIEAYGRAMGVNIKNMTTQKEKGKVFVTAHPTISKTGDSPDLRPLAEYGDIQFLSERGDHVAFKTKEAIAKIRKKLLHFNPLTDYITSAGGDSLAPVITGMVLCSLGHSMFRWLRYERPRPGVDEPRYSITEVFLDPLLFKEVA